MKPITPEIIVQLLNENIQLEHAAIVQYQYHAFLMGEDGMKYEVEEIAREEMRHFMWFSEAVVELGGKPTVERDPLFLGEDRVDMFRKNIDAEKMAIERYRQQLEMIHEPRIKSLLARVISDEQAHAEEFEELLSKAEAQVHKVQESSEDESQTSPAMDSVVNLLNQDIHREYTTILQYLYQSFTTPVCEIGKEILMIAQEEMKHLAWLAEQVVDQGGVPNIERDQLIINQSTKEMLQGNIQREKDTEVQYRSHMEAIPDPEIKKMLARIEGQETYQRGKFERFLTEIEEGGGKEFPPKMGNYPGKLTVGSLFRQNHEVEKEGEKYETTECAEII